MVVVKFAQLQSCVDMSFWSELGERKLNEYKLSDAAVPVRGWFGPSRYVQLPGQLQLDASSFPPATASPAVGEDSGSASTVQTSPLHHDLPKPGLHGVPGTLINFNTLDAFRAAEKQQLLQQAASQLWSDLLSGAAAQDPALLARFSLITFADLKTFKFTYWFMFPVLKPRAPFTSEKASTLQAALGQAASLRVCAACDAWRGLTPGAMGLETASSAPVGHPAWLLVASDPELSDLKAMPLSSWESVHSLEGQTRPRVFLAVPDPSNLEGYPGWTLRNVLLMAAVRWGARQIQVVGCRDLKGRTDPNRSQLIDIGLPQIPLGWCQGDKGAPDCVGWEPNAEGRLQAREVDLSAHMSPHHLAEQAVDLNLHLMRWRAAPELDTQRVADAKCLLLGAGTLGCAVARTLLAWGVRHITFLDSSRVSFSNPVRQSLYDFNDCVEGGKPKAQAAADALQRIFPSVRSTGVALSIPMPGHLPSTPTQLEAARQATAQLDELLASHDAVFLLTDTRESRWLPSLLAAAHDRVAITSAVGFDSFLVMRHGAAPSRPLPHPACARLGCYFCNDVVAPLNSTKDRTLDQQCTVARPGLAPIAGAVAVELLVALLQHPLRQSAPTPSWKPPPVAPGSNQAAGVVAEGVLGSVPHMVRGQLNGFQQTCMEGAAFSQCTACSPTVVDRYKSQGWDFILEALKDPRSLEDLTGLTALHQQAMDMLNCDDSDEDEDERKESSGSQPIGDHVQGAGAGSGTVQGAEQDLEDWDTL